MPSEPWPRALVDGRLVPLSSAALPITDPGLARGDGAFETIGVWDGTPFELDAHLERLAVSLRAILLPAPDLARLREDVLRLLEGVDGDAALRVYVTASGTSVVTLDDPPARRPPDHLLPYTAPWIRPRGAYGPAGAKTISYLHHMVATRTAEAAGADDALLLTDDGTVLEGPTFSVYWARGGTLYAPALELGVIDSITRRCVLTAAARDGVAVVTGAHALDDLLAADEVMASSAVRDVLAVRRVGAARFDGPTPLRDRLSEALRAARRGGTARSGRAGPAGAGGRA